MTKNQIFMELGPHAALPSDLDLIKATQDQVSSFWDNPSLMAPTKDPDSGVDLLALFEIELPLLKIISSKVDESTRIYFFTDSSKITEKVAKELSKFQAIINLTNIDQRALYLLEKYGVSVSLSVDASKPFKDFCADLDTVIDHRPGEIRFLNEDRVASKYTPLIIESTNTLYNAGDACMWFHTLCEATNLNASRVLQLFWQFMQENKTNDIFEAQDSFASSVVRDPDLLLALKSYMELHQAISYLSQTGQRPVAYLSFDPNVLNQLDDTNIHDFVRNNRSFDTEKEYELFFDDGQLFFEPLESL